MRRFVTSSTLAAFWLGLAGVAAAQSGKITGTITDTANDNEPMIGVTVQLEGTDLGAVTDLDGNYTIIGVRPGTYVVTASYAGYQPARVTNVRVSIDLTTRIDIAMRESAQAEELVVTGIGEAPLVQRDVTATTAIVGAEEIAALPVENFGDVVALQAGVVNGHFRGGRSGEVGYWVDGLPVTDAYNGGLGVSIENSMVQELQVVTGAFNAEYGQALSGIVNVVTKDGENRFSGSVSGFMGDYASSHSDLFRGVDQISPLAVRNVEANLSGPVVKDRLWFFTTARYFGNDGFLKGQNRYVQNSFFLDANNRTVYNDTLRGDMEDVDFNPYEKVSGQVKLTYRVNRNMRFAASAIASRDWSRGAGYNLLFLPENRRLNQNEGLSSYLKFTHTLSSKTFYEIGLIRNSNRSESYLYKDPLDARYITGGVSTDTYTSGFTAGGTDNGRFNRSTTTYLGKVDVTSQVNRYNMVKTGVEFRRHTLVYNDDYTVIENVPGTLTRDTAYVATGGRYRYNPVEFAAYVQDKIEVAGLIVNVGLRADYFNANGVVLRDDRDPNALFLERRLVGQDPANLDYTPDEYFEASEGKFQLSPRLGVAFPISEGGVVHFSYGFFFQTPNYERLYQNPYFQLGAGGSGLVGLIGNANLNPEQTISYELGLKQQIGQGAAVEVTAYARDIRNLTGTATDPIQIDGTAVSYGQFSNTDFGFVRGIILRFDQRVGRNGFAGMDYTYQIARANSSDPSQVYNAAASKVQLETQLVRTPWDQRHTANFSFGFNKPNDWSFGVIARLGSGEPYTPSRNTLQAGGTIQPSSIQLNSLDKPFVYNADLDASKVFRLQNRYNVTVFGRVSNLFDRLNQYDVFSDTGSAAYTLDQTLAARTFVGDPAILERWYTQPYRYGEPRRVTIGLSLSF